MNWKVSIGFLLLASVWCSTATSQQGPLRPNANAHPATPQGPRTAQPTRQPSAAQPRETPQDRISPRRATETTERNARPAKEPFSFGRVVGSLILVIAGIFGIAKLFKTLGIGPFGSVQQIPNAACEMLGMMAMPQRHTLYLMRIGQRILLMGSTGENLTVLSEITEPEEVAALTRLCTAKASEGAADSSFLSRLWNQGLSLQPSDASPAPSEKHARQELEARLGTFAKS